MVLAGSSIETKIGLLDPRDQQQSLSRIARNHLATFHFRPEVNYNSDDLCDLQRMLRFKALRAWLPPVELLLLELRRSADEQKVHLVDRRNCHMNGIKVLVKPSPGQECRA